VSDQIGCASLPAAQEDLGLPGDAVALHWGRRADGPLQVPLGAVGALVLAGGLYAGGIDVAGACGGG